ncbi:MAG: bacteriocin biosynthesis cyclodehydratase domain protein [Deltaproteobacteria bacterium]|nr:bacteriocin biosynthesis cyclodehydratase domain protein [Deltaproteobacteria bacterium]
MLDRPRFQPHLQVEIVPGEGVVLLSETQQVILPGLLYALVAPHLDGRHSLDAIVAALRGRAASSEIRGAVEELERQGFLTEFRGNGGMGEAALWASHGVDPGVAQQRLAKCAVSVAGVGGVTVEPFLAALCALGVRVSPNGQRQIVITDDYLRPDLERYNQEALAAEREWLLVKLVGCVVWLGPVFRPGRNACWECLAQRLRANRTVERFLAQRNGRAQPLALARASTSATEQIATHLAASAVAAWLARDEAPELDGTVVTFDLRLWRTETHRVVWRPQCRACGDPPEITNTAARPIVLESRRKTFTLEGGHRTRTPEATVERYQHHVSPVSGAVPKLALNGTQRDGVMHAYVAGANLSRPPRTLDLLREGLRSRTGGKGASDAQARASALCEALERFSGVFCGEEPRRQRRFVDLGDAAIHPNACMGFSDRQYRDRDAWNARGELTQAVPLPFDEEAVVSWTPVWSLTRNEPRYLPTAFCFYDYPVFPEAAYCIACSNGNAAGNTLEEAILQGFLELVERDSVALWWYSRVRRPAVALDSFAEPYLRRVEAYLAERGRDLAVLDLTSDLEVPVFAAIARRGDTFPEQIVFGFGAHLDPRIAVLRAVTELNQMLMRVLWASERAEPSSPSDGEPSVREWLETATLAEHPYLAPDPARPQRTAADYAQCWSDDLRQDVQYCQALVQRCGMEFLVLDQTRPDIALPVVKVIVPGLRHFWPRFAPGRLYDIPVQLGWLSEPLSEAQLNPVAMFL